MGVRTSAGLVALLAIAIVAAPAAAQTTTAERTDFRETSTYADVLAFLDSLQRDNASLRIGTLASSPEGRAVPYVITARPMVANPAEAHRTGKPVVYIQANIHAGEVEGKEVAQMLLRDLNGRPLAPLLDSVILIVVPIYNTDGNERFASGERNRPGQNGPAIVGQNLNGQGLNLNRDYIKMEAPETRGSVALLNQWDPDLFIDLHTTNGSYHGYALTYSPGLNPNSSPANDYVRDKFLPLIRERMRRRHHFETFWYGNFRNQEPDSLKQGWETYEPRPRFGTNWAALRGRLAILSEGYSNAEFKTRVMATYAFVREILSLAVAERTTIKTLVATSSRRRPDSIVVRSTYAPPTDQDVIVEITHAAGEGSGGYARRQRTGEYRTIRMPVFDRFAPTRKEARPVAYLLPVAAGDIVELLRRQGVLVQKLKHPWRGAVQTFAIDSIVSAPVPFEGHRLVRLEGRWGDDQPVDFPAGSYLVRTDQTLGTFAAAILEPASEDGLVTWNFFDRTLRAHGEYPVTRTRASVVVETTEVE